MNETANSQENEYLPGADDTTNWYLSVSLSNSSDSPYKMLSLLPVEILLKVCSCLSFRSLVKIERVDQRLRYIVKEQLFKDAGCRVRMQIGVDTEAPEGTRVFFCLKSNSSTATHIAVANGSRCTVLHHKKVYCAQVNVRTKLQSQRRPGSRNCRGNFVTRRLGVDVGLDKRHFLSNRYVWSHRMSGIIRAAVLVSARAETPASSARNGRGTFVGAMPKSYPSSFQNESKIVCSVKSLTDVCLERSGGGPMNPVYLPWNVDGLLTTLELNIFCFKQSQCSLLIRALHSLEHFTVWRLQLAFEPPAMGCSAYGFVPILQRLQTLQVRNFKFAQVPTYACRFPDQLRYL